MFPDIAKYYSTIDSENYFLKLILQTINFFDTNPSSNLNLVPVVLFGGIISTIYSILQFIATRFWGSLSDLIGRRTVLLISVGGLTLSYLLWVFANSFSLFLLSRVLSGIMGGKISTGTAVIADITDTEKRVEGMAMAGMVLGLGFIIGPAIGGLFCIVDLTYLMNKDSILSLNPFSFPALIAFLLSFYNFIILYFKFEETLPEEKRHQTQKTVYNILIGHNFIKPVKSFQVSVIMYSFFILIIAYSGMEFTLTFIACERLNYSPLNNSFMFIFAGILVAAVQGTFVKLYARKIGEKTMALYGIAFLIPGFFLIGQIQNSLTLYAGLMFIAIGTALSMPTIASLVSLQVSDNHQGKVIGELRSFGALGRVLGPFSACFIYWKFGSHSLYSFGPISLLIPLFLIGFAISSKENS